MVGVLGVDLGESFYHFDSKSWGVDQEEYERRQSYVVIK